jgi:hypothetical protein
MASTVTNPSFPDLKHRLDKNKKPGDKDLYSHVSKVMAHIVRHCPDDGMNKLEEVSYILKHSNTIKKEEFLKTKVNKDYAKPSDEVTKACTQVYIDSCKKYFVVSFFIAFIMSPLEKTNCQKRRGRGGRS